MPLYLRLLFYAKDCSAAYVGPNRSVGPSLLRLTHEP
jgi:hypothetical protein